jgi:uncharacterized protein (TIGR00297 family)
LHWTVRLIVIFGAMGILLGVAEALRRSRGIQALFTRKVIHTAMGFVVLLSPLFFRAKYPVLVAAAILFLIDLFVLRFSQRFNKQYATFGILYYPLVLFVLIFLCWDTQMHVLMGAVCVMSFGDGLAAFVGTVVGRHRFTVTGDPKSLEGSLAMYAASAISLFPVLAVYTRSPLLSLWAALLVPLVATVVEAASSKGLDNITVPLSCGALIYYLFSQTGSPALWLALSIPSALILSLMALRLRALTPAGAATAFVVGTLVFAIGKLNGAMALIAFFLTSSSLSRIQTTAKKTAKKLSEKGATRDMAQALANGGVPLVLLIASMFNPCWWSYMFFLAALASATADTWATEIGTLSGGKPLSLRNLTRVPPGSSGAVSGVGTTAAAAGSCTIGLFAGFYGQAGEFNVFAFAAVAISGFAGCMFDSLLGATAQAQYSTADGILSETADEDGRLSRGVPWIRNDMVNFVSTASAAVICWLIFLTLGPNFCQ